MLVRQVYKDNLVAVVVEAHCVHTWGNEFRVAFPKLETYEVSYHRTSIFWL